jgi:uncharacterized damage-inducible protein DinB
MNTIKQTLTLQYAMVQDARCVLLDFCSKINDADFIRSSGSIGNGGSIKNLMVHMCNSYFGWLSHFAAKQPFNKIAYDSIDNLSQCSAYFLKVDALVQEFLVAFDNNYEEPITGTIAGVVVTSTPLQLFTHGITHEFHHKGQILALSRMWGYTPIDTDILR